jgi:hypothetical protein
MVDSDIKTVIATGELIGIQGRAQQSVVLAFTGVGYFPYQPFEIMYADFPILVQMAASRQTWTLLYIYRVSLSESFRFHYHTNCTINTLNNIPSTFACRLVPYSLPK